jgi:hypothetical protein
VYDGRPVAAGSTPSKLIPAKSSAPTNTSITRTGLLSSMKSSRHPGNGVHCPRSASSTKRSQGQQATWPPWTCYNERTWLSDRTYRAGILAGPAAVSALILRATETGAGATRPVPIAGSVVSRRGYVPRAHAYSRRVFRENQTSVRKSDEAVQLRQALCPIL